MRLSSRRLHQLRPRILTLALLILILTFILPYDNTLVLFIRWHLNTVRSWFRSSSSPPSWTHARPRFPLDVTTDVGIILKTGFSTQDRLLARLAAFEPGRGPENLVLVGDYSTSANTHFVLNKDGIANNGGPEVQIPVHNALAGMIDSGALLARPRAERLQYYWNLTTAIANGDEDLAFSIGRVYGWELDIMKVVKLHIPIKRPPDRPQHVSGLEVGYRTMPQKKWYILIDDDTYLLNGSLELLLQHLDPAESHYIGNAVGDYKARFAHGGSAVVLSYAAMRRIFVSHPQIVAAAHLESLDSSWGDKLIATTAMKSGVYLEERYARHFNGEPPRATRIRPDRFCAPLVSFHKIPVAEMPEVARTFMHSSPATVSWLDVWGTYDAPPFAKFLDDPVRLGWDHVGARDEAVKTSTNVKTAAACLAICLRRTASCLAWAWDTEAQLCHISPWMVIGVPSKGLSSGINAQRAAKLAAKCV